MDSSATGDALVREQPGTRIGRYKLLQVIGQGGFGVVWMAEQEEPVRRRVALKVLKLGMDTKAVVARFEAERQALALMDHPGIAKVLDGGATEFGRPYFVMELVHGIPITKFCDERKLSPTERLELFRKVCAAVQHAHQKGVIHRDLKPNNVLVGEHDGVPAPKVIDFGIAKATAGSLTELTLVTEYRQMIGTPEYMAPEQAAATGLDIDTRADIYSLGVVLYELLTGTKPFELKTVSEQGYDEILRYIREVEPPKPSTRISSLGENIAIVAERRRLAPQDVRRVLRGDLDWIAMKALEKERSRRYDSAIALADDVGRYLADQPVLASPPSTVYRVRKYVRRHRFGVAAGLAIAVALIVGLVATTLALWRARDAEARVRTQFAAAEDARKIADEQRAAAQASEHAARIAAAQAEKIAAFAQSMLSGIEPDVAQGLDTKLLQSILDDSAARIEKDFASEPEVAASMHVTVGKAYASITSFEAAERHLRTADEMQTKLLGPEARATLRTRNSLAFALHRQSKFTEAQALLEPTLETQRRLFGENDRDTLDTQVRLGDVLWFQGKSHEGVALLRDAYERCERTFGPDDRDTDAAMFALAQSYWGQDRYTEAETMLRRLLEVRERRSGPNMPSTITAMATLALVLHEENQVKESKSLYREALSRARRVFGNKHQSTLTIMNNLASRLDAPEEVEEAEALAREAYEGRLALFGESNYETLTSMTNLASVLARADRDDDAEELYRRAVAISRRLTPPSERDLMLSLVSLAEFLGKHSKQAEAAEFFGEAALLKRKLHGEDRPDVWLTYYHWAATLQNTGQDDQAEPVYREMLVLYDKYGGKEEPYVAAALNGLGKCLASRGEYEAALPWMERGLAMRRRIRPAQHTEIGLSLYSIGHTLLALEQYERAEPVLREGLALWRAAEPYNLDVPTLTVWIGVALGGQGRFAEGEPLILEGCAKLDQRGDLARMREGFGRAVEFYERWSEQSHGDAVIEAKADTWRDKLAELPEEDS